MSEYHRYPARVFFSEEDEGYVAVAPDLPGCSAFGDSPELALRELQDAVQAWIGAAAKAGNPIPPPTLEQADELPSGRVLLRLPRTLHALLLDRAERDKASLNTCIVMLLSRALAGDTAQIIDDPHRVGGASVYRVPTTFASFWMDKLRAVSDTQSETIVRGGSVWNLRALPANVPVIVKDDDNG